MIAFEQAEPSEDILVEYKIKKESALLNEKEVSNDQNLNDEDKENNPGHKKENILKNKEFLDQFKIEGYVSNCSHGLGRSAPG